MAAAQETGPHSARSPWRRARWRRPALAALAGALPALAFPAPALWWLAWGALVPWLLLARGAGSGRRAAVAGWAGGTGFVLAVHHWLLPNLHVFLPVLAVLMGALWAPWGWLVWRLLRRPGPWAVAGAAVLVPSGWLLVEVVRSWEYAGGPWGLYGASQWQVVPALRLASVGGVWLVSFVLVAVNTAVAALVVLCRRGRPHGAVAAVCVLAACAGGLGAAWTWAPVPRGDGKLRVGVVQPGVVQGQRARLARSEELTRRLTGRGVDLVVWGESSVSFDLTNHPRLRSRIAALSEEIGARILVNVDARRSDRPGIYKSSVLIGPHGQVGRRYDKMRLVPFGEYVPARSLLGWATSVGRAADEDRLRGKGPVLMETSGVRFGPLVCFESAFPDMSRQLVRDGARLIVTQSATSTFQESWAPQQHASLAALRAAEAGRPLVHATLTGVSAVHGPRGERVGPWLGTSRATARVYAVPLAAGSTLYVRSGDWIVYGSAAAMLLYGTAAGARAFRRRGERPGPDSPSPAGG